MKKHKGSKGSAKHKLGVGQKAKSSAMGINMGRTGQPQMGAVAPWGGQPPPMGMPMG